MAFLLDKDARLDFAWDFTAWLADAETIASYSVTATTGVTVDTVTESNGIVTAWLSSGTAGTSPKVTCHITTDAGREDDRTITVRITER